MHFLELIPSALRHHSRAPALARLHELYARIESAQTAFKASFAASALAGGSERGISCPEGCGSCCEGFVPDILPLEAEYLAAWLIEHRPEAASAAPDHGPPPCAFYDAENEAAHCSVYPARPLVCRLFAFAASRDREGRPRFALCKLMPEIPFLPGRSWSGEELETLGGSALPIMSDFASELLALDPGAAEQRAPLGKALESALGKLRLALSYAPVEFEPECEGSEPAGGGAAGEDDEPEPNAPAPKAA